MSAWGSCVRKKVQEKVESSFLIRFIQLKKNSKKKNRRISKGFNKNNNNNSPESFSDQEKGPKKTDDARNGGVW